MKTDIGPEILDVIDSLHYHPAISIIMSFNTKMGLKAEMTHSLKIAADKVELYLQKYYPGEMCTLMMRKLKNIFATINFDPDKKSIAIYLSPVFEKVLFLDIAVEEKIIIDESFEIRDLVYSKKQLDKFLVLLLTGKENRMFLYNSKSLVRILTDSPESVYAYINELPERVANFSDISKRKEIVMDKFLHHADNSLHEILKKYHLPIFVLGAKRALGHFKKHTKHAEAIIGYVPGNYEEASLEQLNEILEPFITAWKNQHQKDLLNQLEEAANTKKLAVGIKEVWHEVMNNKGRLLVVERDYMYAARHGSKKEIIYPAGETKSTIFDIKDAVDDLIEMILKNGGDVEFVEKGFLNDYDHIALVQYY